MAGRDLSGKGTGALHRRLCSVRRSIRLLDEVVLNDDDPDVLDRLTALHVENEAIVAELLTRVGEE